MDWMRRRPLLGGLAGSAAPDAAFLLLHAGARLGHPLAALLPLADANADVLAAAPEALKSSGGRPVLAGVCATDPTRLPDRLLDGVADAGFAGVLNMPSVGFFDGIFRSNLESTGLRYGREVDVIARASKRGLAAFGLAFTADEARRMAEAGAQAVVLHPGPSGRLDADSAGSLAAAARAGRRDVAVLAAADAALGLDGFLSGLLAP